MAMPIGIRAVGVELATQGRGMRPKRTRHLSQTLQSLHYSLAGWVAKGGEVSMVPLPVATVLRLRLIFRCFLLYFCCNNSEMGQVCRFSDFVPPHLTADV